MTKVEEEKKMSTFKRGDTVRLKSGGPIMTVRQVSGYVSQEGVVTADAKSESDFPVCCCVWFTPDAKRESSEFGEDLLVAATPVDPDKAAMEVVKSMMSGLMSGMPGGMPFTPPLDPKDQS